MRQRPVRILGLHMYDPSGVRDLIADRARRFFYRQLVAVRGRRVLNVIAADANEILAASEQQSGRRIAERFNLTGLERT